MKKFFKYNWQVRDEWFKWCHQLTHEELLKIRQGGMGSILHTLFHIVEVEYSWMRGILGEEDHPFYFEDYATLQKIEILSSQLRTEIAPFLKLPLEGSNHEFVRVAWDETPYTVEDILHHLIAHEIHHIGQLSVWAREIGLSPVPVHFIGRNLI